MKQLTFADGMVQLGGEELPGLLQSLVVDGKVRYDEQQVDGLSGTSKTPQGWEDHNVTAVLLLTTDEDGDCYEKLERLTPFFISPDARANPAIYVFTNRHAVARGMRLVVFDRLVSAENIQTDEIRVTLYFTEHNPPVIRAEGNAARTPTAPELAEQAREGRDGAAPEVDDKISGDLSK